jgi:flagellin
MALFINTNVASLYAQNNLSNSQGALATSIQRLSSGLRINSAKDDAAGFAIAARMTSQIGGLMQAAQNANDGISMAQTAGGALSQVTSDLQAMRNLAVQAANGTNSASDRASIQASMSQLQQDINNISNNTQYNGLNLLDGSLTNVQFQVGANANQTINASIGSVSATSIGNNTLATSSTGTIVDAAAGAANNYAGGTITISGNGQTVTTSALAAGASANAIAAAVNAASSSTGVTASALTTATLGNFTAGTVSLTLQGAPTSTGGANPVTIQATLATSTDVAGLAAAINAQTGVTGITAVADLAAGTIALTQTQGYDISVTNGASSSGSVDMTGAATSVGGSGTPITLATSGQGTVGGLVSLNSSSGFTATSAGANLFSATTAQSSQLSSVGSIDVTQLTNGIPTGANNALQIIDSAINFVDQLAGDLGALQTRFQNAQSMLNTTSTNLQQARSRIQDTDFASETANLTHQQILEQAGTAMLAQANAMPNVVMTLLK